MLRVTDPCERLSEEEESLLRSENHALFAPVPMSHVEHGWVFVACEMDRGGIWVAVSVGCVRGSVYVCVCVGGGRGRWS